MRRRTVVLGLLCLLAWGCRGDAPPPPPPPITVAISPAQVQTATGGSVQFSCAVTGSQNGACTWAVAEGAAGGTVDAAGLYRAPAAAGTYHVVATSVADPARSARAEVRVTAQDASRRPWVTGYYAGYYWDQMYPPLRVDMSAMTHFVFARVAPGGGSLGGAPAEVVKGAGTAHDRGVPGAPDPNSSVEDFLVARAHAAGIKALLMLGGDGLDGRGFVLSSADNVRATFVRRIVDYLVAHDYDGIDVDWENHLHDGPELAALGVSQGEARRRLLRLITDLRQEAAARARYRDRPITITFPGYPVNINFLQPGGRVEQWQADVANLVDQYNLMTYGIGTAFSGGGWRSWFSGPLRGATGEMPVDIESSINAYVATGVHRKRLGIGIGFYGMYYGPPIRGPRQPTGSNAWVPGDQGTEYNMLVRLGYLSHGTYTFDETAKVGYRTYSEALYPNGFIPSQPPHNQRPGAGFLTYEDERSIEAKGQWVRQNGVGGTIVWMINYGYLPDGTNPLLAAVKRSFAE